MSDPVLHIKDSFYFEVPKALCPSNYASRKDFPPMWGRNDPTYQDWEFKETYHGLGKLSVSSVPAEDKLHHDWLHWRDHEDNHANFAKPFWRYLDESHAANVAGFESWKAAEIAKAKAATDPKPADIQKATDLKLVDYLESSDIAKPEIAWFSKGMLNDHDKREWTELVSTIQKTYWDKYTDDKKQPEWSKETLDAYNNHLAGKILIPQFFGTQRNLYEPESGFSLSKFMVIELLVAVVLVLVFGWIGSRAKPGGSPKGLFWNLLEVFLVFIRDQIARPAIGGHHHEEGHENDKIEAESTGYATATHAKELDRHAPKGPHQEQVEHHSHAHGHHDQHHNPYELADSFVPMLWTIFLFILGCNLCGMIPWIGTPTSAWSVTLGLAIVTFLTVCIAGISQFGVLGFLANQVPSMDVPFPMNLIIKPMIFAIEMFGLLIKHMVLSIRLLANMVAGHLVLLGIMGIAFSAANAEFFLTKDPGWIYPVAATASVLASTALSLLELGVAFLQAYVFTLLSALFIGAAVHKH